MSRADRMGLAAAREAVAQSGLDLAREDPERIGVILGGGTSGLLDSEAYYEKHLKGAGTAVARLEPPAGRDHRPGRAALRARGHQVDDHDGLLLVRQRDGIRPRRDRGGPRRRRPDRRLGRARAPDLRRIQLAAVRGPRALPPVRPRAQGPLDRRGGRHPRLRGVGAREAPRRADPRRIPGLRGHLRRVPHDRAGPERGRRRPHRPERARGRRRQRGGRRLRQRARHGDAAERLGRDGRAQGGPRRPGRANPDLLDQVDDRTLPVRLGGDRGRRDGADRPRGTRASHDPLREPRPRLRPRLRAERGARAAVDVAISDSFAFGGNSSVVVFAREAGVY